jgi:hypothetical protein
VRSRTFGAAKSGARDERSDKRDQLTRAAKSGARDERSDKRDQQPRAAKSGARDERSDKRDQYLGMTDGCRNVSQSRHDARQRDVHR